MYNSGHGLMKFVYLYSLILYVALPIFFPSRVIFSTWKRRSIILRFEKKKKKRSYSKSNKFCSLFARFLQVEYPKQRYFRSLLPECT